MQTIIMTVGTSLLTNQDKDLLEKRPWVGQKTIGDRTQAVGWLNLECAEVLQTFLKSGLAQKTEIEPNH